MGASVWVLQVKIRGFFKWLFKDMLLVYAYLSLLKFEVVTSSKSVSVVDIIHTYLNSEFNAIYWGGHRNYFFKTRQRIK